MESVTLDLKPVIDLQVFGQDAHERTISAIVDTGFSDSLTLPRSTIMALGWPLTDFVEVILANGKSVVLDAHVGSVLWEGRKREISVLASDSGAYIGMGLLYGSRIIIDAVYGGEVSISPMS